MNIIVINTSLRYVHPSSDFISLNDIVIYAWAKDEDNYKNITKVEMAAELPADPELNGPSTTYMATFTLEVEKIDHYKQYDRYRIIPIVLPQGAYKITVYFNGKDGGTNIAAGSSLTNNTETIKIVQNVASKLQDENLSLSITNRTITVVPEQVLLVAEDTMSQQIRFKIKRCYDGVSFVDSNLKTIFIDYIPPNWDKVKQDLINQEMAKDTPDLALISAIEAIEFIHSSLVYEEIPDEPDYVNLVWDVPYLATIQAGTLKVAISISNKVDPEDPNPQTTYLWQTLPASLTVSPNIGKRKTQGYINFTSIADFDARLSDLENIFAPTNIGPTVTLDQGTGG